MSVKKKDRHVSMKAPLEHVRRVVDYALILTRPRVLDKNGKQIQKSGILGQGQPFQVFGFDIITSAKKAHSACFEASEIKLKDAESLEQRTALHQKALSHCRVILQELDLCIYQYAKDSKKKRGSFMHMALLTRALQTCLYDRMNRDKLILEGKLEEARTFRRGR